jgi:hypothetical protein
METFKNAFVQSIPEQLVPGVLYVSMERSVAIHLCACGCGNEVVTPLSPVDWQLQYDGEVISLSPSIGNWNFKCQSHYWIVDNRIKWAGSCSKKQIDEGRDHHRSRRKELESKKGDIPLEQKEPLTAKKEKISVLRRILRLFRVAQ